MRRPRFTFDRVARGWWLPLVAAGALAGLAGSVGVMAVDRLSLWWHTSSLIMNLAQVAAVLLPVLAACWFAARRLHRMRSRAFAVLLISLGTMLGGLIGMGLAGPDRPDEVWEMALARASTLAAGGTLFFMLGLLSAAVAGWLPPRAVHIRGTHCARCGYERVGLADSSLCPECGRGDLIEPGKGHPRARRVLSWSVPALLLAAVGSQVWHHAVNRRAWAAERAILGRLAEDGRTRTWFLTTPTGVVTAQAGVIEPPGWHGWALVCAVPTDEAERARTPLRIELAYGMPLAGGPGSREYMRGPAPVGASLSRSQAEAVVRDGLPESLIRLFEPHVPIGTHPTITQTGVFESMVTWPVTGIPVPVEVDPSTAFESP
jgi:hypothetical protein